MKNPYATSYSLIYIGFSSTYIRVFAINVTFIHQVN